MPEHLAVIAAVAVGLAIGVAVGLLLSSSQREQAVAEAVSAVKTSEAVAIESARAAAERVAALQAEAGARDGELRKLAAENSQGHATLKEREKELELLRPVETRLTAQLADKDRECKELAATHAKLREEAASFDAKIEHFKQMQDELKKAFAQLATDALQKNNELFIERAKSELEKTNVVNQAEIDKKRAAFEALVKPIKENLDKYDQKIASFELERGKAHAELLTHVQSARAESEKLKTETSKLANALRGAPAARGRWGEMELKKVVELAGMEEHVSFETQVSMQTEDGVQRPDMLVRLPGRKTIVVDAKVPAKGYFEALEETDEARRAEKIQEHAAQVRAQTALLSSKGYWKQFEQSPDFVAMFMPEPLFRAALQADPTLLDDAMEKKVILVTPMTLLGLLKTVSFGWRQEAVARNAQEISELGKRLYHAIAVFAAHMDDIRSGLNTAVLAYGKAIGSLERTVLAPAREFKHLGVTASDEIAVIEAVESATRELSAPEFKTPAQEVPLLIEPRESADAGS